MNAHDLIEYVYLLTSGPGLLIAAIIGLRSLRISKQSVELTDRRERLTATTRQIEQFATVIAPKIDVLEEYVTQHKVVFFEAWEVHLTPEGVAVERTQDIETMDDFIKAIPTFLPVLNALSAWSAYFTTNVADEAVAYKTLGPDFIHAAGILVPAILALGKEKAHRDLLDLYEMWRSRLEHEFLVEDAQSTLSRLDELDRITRGKGWSSD